jgi:dTDP-4-dehydrorhamnose 3,5-epimerase
MTEPPSGSAPFDDGNSHAVPLSANVERALSFQRYEGQQTIEGVRLIRLQKHRAENGWFSEIFRLMSGSVRLGDGEESFELRQVSAARADPYRINAFHIHPKVPQHELWTVLAGSLTVWLVDCRLRSSTEGTRQRVQLTAEEPALLKIPAGVAHGYRAGQSGALLLYGMNQQFDRDDPNEGRLPWDFFGPDLWEDDRG